MTPVNEPLLELFRAHGIEAESQGEWVVFPGRPMRAGATVVQENEQGAWWSVQLDVRLEIAPERTIVESFASSGTTRDEAVADALRNFVSNSFHVLLAAFFRTGNEDSQVVREQWVIGGRTSRVTLGGLGVRGQPPGDGEAPLGWFGPFEAKLREAQLRPGIHWVRLYYAQMRGETTACEVLLNNDEWSEVQLSLSVFSWPHGEDFYSVRMFLVIEVPVGGAVSPETAVIWLLDILAERPQFTEVEVYAAMAEAGIPAPLADRAFKFTLIAAGRALLAGLAIRSSPEYVCADASGTVIESGRLAEEPCFAAASRLVGRYAGTPWFRRLAAMSADVQAVNEALHAGSRGEDLVTDPPLLFLEPPTPEGLERARRMMEQHQGSRGNHTPLTPGSTSPQPTRPWWQIWR